MNRFLAARVRRAHRTKEQCAIWVDCCYMEPYGSPTWAVRVHHGFLGDYEAGRSCWLWLALMRAWKNAPKDFVSEAEGEDSPTSHPAVCSISGVALGGA